jgi:hypothetical protein
MRPRVAGLAARGVRNPYDAHMEASLIYRRNKNLRVVQLLFGHTKLESTVRYLGIEVDEAVRSFRGRFNLPNNIDEGP